MTYLDFMNKWGNSVGLTDRLPFAQDVTRLSVAAQMKGYDNGMMRAKDLEYQIEKIVEIVGCDY